MTIIEHPKPYYSKRNVGYNEVSVNTAKEHSEISHRRAMDNAESKMLRIANLANMREARAENQRNERRGKRK
jgi:hypothetical protein